MQTIRLRVNEKVYKHLMFFLNKFSKDELQIIDESEHFLSTRKELQQELDILEKGNAEFVDLQELDDKLESTIKKHQFAIS